MVIAAARQNNMVRVKAATQDIYKHNKVRPAGRQNSQLKDKHNKRKPTTVEDKHIVERCRWKTDIIR